MIAAEGDEETLDKKNEGKVSKRKILKKIREGTTLKGETLIEKNMINKLWRE